LRGVSHRTALEPVATDSRARWAGIVLGVAGAVAILSSFLTWRTVTTSVTSNSALVIQRVSGVHYTRSGGSNVGVGYLTLLLGILALAVGAVVTLRGGLTLLVAALISCGVIVLAITVYETSTTIHASHNSSFVNHPAIGIWLSFAACVVLCADGLTYLIGQRRAR
jgi:hypothetical protein